LTYPDLCTYVTVIEGNGRDSSNYYGGGY